ncbi:MAG: hypothetical protein ACYC7E_20380 [Armatimonadota bacterium]
MGDSGEVDKQAVLIYLVDNDLPDEVYDQYDVATLEDQLIDVIDTQGLGEYDGNEFGPEETILFMYTPDAERLYAGIKSILESYPLCRNARAVIRYGGPGAKEREERITLR